MSYLSQSGTDSTVTYTVYVRDSVKTRITADQDCEEGSYFIVQVEGDYRLEWQSDVGDNSVEEIEADSLYHMHPQQPTRYYLYASYRDEPACTVVDSIDLDPAELVSVVLDFSVTPEEPTSETSYLTLLDQSQNILSREWVVNGVSQIERDAQLTVNIPLSDDTMVLCLVGYRTLCNQTLCKHIPVKRQTIFFPNVFTPGMESNNLFRAIGMGITDFEMWIYDRRGQLVFHTNDFHEGWDGTSGGIRCKQDAYAYTCRYRVRQELGYLRHTGTVVLIR